jgi:nitrous oxidase accessory protein
MAAASAGIVGPGKRHGALGGRQRRHAARPAHDRQRRIARQRRRRHPARRRRPPVEDNVIEDVLFGIHLRQVNSSRIVGNRSPASRSSRACAATRSASGTAAQPIEGNRFQRARDLTFANSPDNRIAGNRFVDGRYGMHVIFSPRLLVENNHLSHTGTGIIVLYSPNLVLRGNHVAHALTGGGAGIVFKESHDALVEGNEVLHCSVGLRVDAPPEAAGKLTVRGNRFAHNIIGLFFYGEEGGHRFYRQPLREQPDHGRHQRAGCRQRQRLARQLTGTITRASTATATASATRRTRPICSPTASGWRRRWRRSSAILPVLEMLDFLERLAPFSSPHLILRDPVPRMK